jgi:ABC-type nitrate/sulfonate/bicarbonate transport system ATPase subunit
MDEPAKTSAMDQCTEQSMAEPVESATDRVANGCSGAEMRLEQVSITLGANQIVAGINLDVAAGDFVCLLGPSGCGKSTLLNLVAGFLPATSGRVSVGGRPVRGPSVDRGVVFQSTEALFPWLTVQACAAFHAPSGHKSHGAISSLSA